MRHPVDLVQHQQVGGRHLLFEHAFEFATVVNLLGVHDDHGGVVGNPPHDRLPPEIELCVVGQRHARSLDHHPVGVGAFAQHLERFDQLIREPTTHAAAAQLDIIVTHVSQKRLVDTELAELVRNERHPDPVRLRVFEDAPDERGLARAEKARDDECGYLAHHLYRGSIRKNQRFESSPSSAQLLPYFLYICPSRVAISAGLMIRRAVRL